MVLHQHEAAQLRAEMPRNALRQRGDDARSVRGNPAFTPVTHHPCTHHDILHQEGLVALEVRACRWPCLQHLLLDADPRLYSTTPTALVPLGWSRRFACLLHAAWLYPRPPLQSLQPGDLLPLLRHQLLQRGDVTKQPNNQGFKLRSAQARQGFRVGHTASESYSIEPDLTKNAPRPRVLPLLRKFDTTVGVSRSACATMQARLGRTN